MITEELLNDIIDALDDEHCRRLIKTFAGLKAPMPVREVILALADQEQE